MCLAGPDGDRLSTPKKVLLGTDLAQVLRTHMERLERVIQVLPPQDFWWRPHEESLSIGMILLHLEGNLRQWVLAGLGGVEDTRQRASEFSGQSTKSAVQVFDDLSSTHARSLDVIASIEDQDLAQEHTIQGYLVTTQAAILHVTEHFSWHVGQAVWIAKARAGKGHGLAFYDDDQLG